MEFSIRHLFQTGGRNYRFPVWIHGLILGCMVTCQEHQPTSPFPNQPPETTIFISTERTLNYTQSVQKIYWDGRDPDGMVIGFKYTWKTDPAPSDWIFTTERSRTFPLEIIGQDTIYLFQVAAIDDDSLADPTPAYQYFPVKNSPPTISWTQNSRLPDTTFTVSTIIWAAADLDGDATIRYFEYSLDDTSHWRPIPGYLRSMTLTADSGLTEGNHSIYLRAIDIAGSMSPTIRLPEEITKTWYVKQPRGRYLLVDDHNSETSSFAFPDRYYREMLTTVLPPGEQYDVWNIEVHFPKSIIQFRETLKLFQRVIWYTDLVIADDPHFIAAQVAIPELLKAGGKAIFIAQFNTGFGVLGDPLAFTPADSLGNYYSRILPDRYFQPQPDLQQIFPNSAPLPVLKVANMIFGVIALKPKEGAVTLYRYDDPALANDPPFVLLGRNDNTGVYDFVFAGAPLHQINKDGNLNAFFHVILNEVFQ